MAHGRFEGIMKEMVLLLDIWLSEAPPLSSINNDLLFVPRRPLKGRRPYELGFFLCAKVNF
jgi:hypothetical protein